MSGILIFCCSNTILRSRRFFSLFTEYVFSSISFYSVCSNVNNNMYYISTEADIFSGTSNAGWPNVAPFGVPTYNNIYLSLYPGTYCRLPSARVTFFENSLRMENERGRRRHGRVLDSGQRGTRGPTAVVQPESGRRL